jgi:hypothetical protein
MKNLSRLAAALTALVACVPSAFATATASATMTDVRYQLFDLNLTDGIAPAVTFVGQTFASVSATTNSNPGSLYVFNTGVLGEALTTTLAFGSNLGSASITAGPIGPTATGPGAFATATSTGTGVSTSSAGYALSSQFTLTPNTLLVLLASAPTLSVSGTQFGDTAQATVFLQLRGLNSQQVSEGRSFLSLNPNGTISDLSYLTVTASFANLTNLPLDGYASARAQAESMGIGAAVPEPSAYLMLGVGLLVIGARLRQSASS